jgi:acetyltransferase-like isoleucine patch superfamily enzyme
MVYLSIDMADNPNTVPHPAPEAEEVYRRWIQFLDEEFSRHHSGERRAEIVRDQLYQLYLGRPHGGKLNLTLTSELPGNVFSLSLDPENVTLEASHFPDIDLEKFSVRQPLLWFWQMFDRSPLGRHIFAHMGAGVKIYHGVDLTYGYNLSIGDGVTIRQRVLLNDRGGIAIGNNAVIGSFARVYSHTHDPADYEKVTLVATVIGDGARIASHAIVLAGQHVAPGQSVGSFPADRI